MRRCAATSSGATTVWGPLATPSTALPTPKKAATPPGKSWRLWAIPHDIGNTVNRVDHAHSGALMAFALLNKLDMPPQEIGLVCSAIGHHDEKTAFPVNPVAAALILSDKSDVRRSRVRKDAVLEADIHDRVNGKEALYLYY